MTNSRQAVVVVGHGSRRDEANRDVIEVARRIADGGRLPLVIAAFLEIARPTIGEAFIKCVTAGAQDIVVHPYFLSPGRHTRGDLPVAVREAANHYPGITYRISEPLAAHPLVIEAAIERIRETLTPGIAKPRLPPRSASGIVYLVGAGPGDPGLLTVKALERLRQSDVVVYDCLVNPVLLAEAPAHAERIHVGKIGGGKQTSQLEINRLLIDRAQAGKVVVRLKGGDPFLFGRGAEEAKALRDASIAFEVIPGVSSALAVPAYAGIPLTHRGVSSSVTVLTGVHAADDESLSNSLRAATADTLVVLMGFARLRQIADELINAGRTSETPVAVISRGTYDAQSVVTGTLATIADAVDQACLTTPAMIVVGEVVRLREQINWFEMTLQETVLDSRCYRTVAATHSSA